MLKVAIVGCGRIADAHLEQIRTVGSCEVVGACDQEPLMARQLCERFGIPGAFNDLKELLDRCRPNVVHITTPPQIHYQLGKLCLEHGCHIYVEKPFTVTVREAEDLIGLANEKGLKATVGHDLQFSHVARDMRRLVQEGYLGGAPVHLESYYCYDLSEAAYVKALLGDKSHWVRKLPGKLLHNVISHGVARIAEYLPAESPEVLAYGFVSPTLKGIGETDIIDELRVIIGTERSCTAYFTFSSQMHPSLNHFRIFGPKNGLVLDEDHQTLLRCSGRRLKSYAEKFISPVTLAKQQIGYVAANVRRFLANDFHMKSGLRYLIKAFYESITRNTPLPIPYREIILTAKIMESIFNQIYRLGNAHQPKAGMVQPDQSEICPSGMRVQGPAI